MPEQEDLEQTIERLQEKYSSAPDEKTKTEIERLRKEKLGLERKVQSLKKPSVFGRLPDTIFKVASGVIVTSAAGYLLYKYNQSNPSPPRIDSGFPPEPNVLMRSGGMGWLNSIITQQVIEIRDQIRNKGNRNYPVGSLITGGITSLIAAISAAIGGVVGYTTFGETGFVIGASIGAFVGLYPSKKMYDNEHF